MSCRRKKQHYERTIPTDPHRDGRAVVSVYHEARAFTLAPRNASRRDAAEFPYGPILVDGVSTDDNCLTVVLDHKNGFLGGVVVGSLRRPNKRNGWAVCAAD